MIDRLDQRGAQFSEYNVEGQQAKGRRPARPVIDAEFLPFRDMIQKGVSGYIIVIEEILLSPRFQCLLAEFWIRVVVRKIGLH